MHMKIRMISKLSFSQVGYLMVQGVEMVNFYVPLCNTFGAFAYFSSFFYASPRLGVLPSCMASKCFITLKISNLYTSSQILV